MKINNLKFELIKITELGNILIFSWILVNYLSYLREMLFSKLYNLRK